MLGPDGHPAACMTWSSVVRPITLRHVRIQGSHACKGVSWLPGFSSTQYACLYMQASSWDSDACFWRSGVSLFDVVVRHDCHPLPAAAPRRHQRYLVSPTRLQSVVQLLLHLYSRRHGPALLTGPAFVLLVSDTCSNPAVVVCVL